MNVINNINKEINLKCNSYNKNVKMKHNNKCIK